MDHVQPALPYVGPYGLLRRYWLVAKPGIVVANLMAAFGGFGLAARGQVASGLLPTVLAGIALVVASACVVNNVIDREIDRKMARTRNRTLAVGAMSGRAAMVYAGGLGASGLAVLWAGTNALATGLTFLGFVVYVAVYSLALKRTTPLSTLVGSLAGAMPPLAAYCAVSQRFDLGALLVLALFCSWQMPHSYAIAISRYDDYRAADIPVLPVACDIATTKRHIAGHILVFMVEAQLLTVCGYAGMRFFALATVLSLVWFGLACFGAGDDRRQARTVYAFSILVIVAVSLMLAVDAAPIPA
jgi:protoheme IX farnesyltransferase